MFFVLPIDITLIQEWISDIKDISSLDIAVTNKSARPFFLEWLTYFVTDIKISQDSYDSNFTNWIFTRRITFRSLCITSYQSPLVNLISLTRSLTFNVISQEDYRIEDFLKNSNLKHIALNNTSITNGHRIFSAIQGKMTTFLYTDSRLDSNSLFFIDKHKNTLECIKFCFCCKADGVCDDFTIIRALRIIGYCKNLKKLEITKIHPKYYKYILMYLGGLKNIIDLSILFSVMPIFREADVVPFFNLFSNVQRLLIPDRMFYLGTIIRTLAKIKDIELYNNLEEEDNLEIGFETKSLIDGVPIKIINFIERKPHFLCDIDYDTSSIFPYIGINLCMDEDDDEDDEGDRCLDENMVYSFNRIFSGTCVRYWGYEYCQTNNFNFLYNIDHIFLYYQNHDVFVNIVRNRPPLFAGFYECEFTRNEYNYCYDDEIDDINRIIFSSAKMIIIRDCYINLELISQLLRMANNLESLEINNCSLCYFENDEKKYYRTLEPLNQTVNDLKNDGFIQKLCKFVNKR